ncbi:hypothetical protein E4L96_09355 [Massilia arenosa]|uniref:Uncharacterized protein n=1 Tax=Zemynaea arenosa TaxID=2561931 RepID=A0A4Y9SHW1_9BURK|nr:hypothetical protein E4L96_09355 [Massilia arenosa]
MAPAPPSPAAWSAAAVRSPSATSRWPSTPPPWPCCCGTKASSAPCSTPASCCAGSGPASGT